MRVRREMIIVPPQSLFKGVTMCTALLLIAASILGMACAHEGDVQGRRYEGSAGDAEHDGDHHRDEDRRDRDGDHR